MFKTVRALTAALFVILLGAAPSPASSGTARADADGAKPSDFMTRRATGVFHARAPGSFEAIASATIANLPVCTALNEQTGPTMIQTGAGGIVVWDDYRSGQFDIYAQKVSGAGASEWVMNGIPVCKASGNQRYPQLVSDGSGGAIVVWQDGRPGSTFDIYAQRVDALGVALWANDGTPVCTAINSQTQPVVVGDGQGGAVVAWVDERALGSDVYVQRINAGGVVQWTANGVALCTAGGVQGQLAIVSDGQRGAIVAWQDRRGAAGDIYARRVNEAGAPQWAADGVALCAASGEQETPAAVVDGAGGATVGWADARGVGRDVYGQRVNGAGAVQWAADGVALCAATGEQQAPAVCGDGAGGTLVVWQDGRPGAQGQDVYGQRVNGAGVAQWAADGVGLCTAAGDQVGPALAADPMGGAVVAWSDARTPGADIYVQHLAVSGGVQWTAGGVQVCDAVSTQDQARVIPDGQGGAAVVWRDYRGGTIADLYGQRVDAAGQVSDQCTPPDPLLSAQPASTVEPQNYRTFAQNVHYWSGVGVRGLSGDWDIEVYEQGTFGSNPYPICFGEPLAGSFGSSTVDFVVGDFNDFRTPPGNYGARAYRYGGTGGAVIEWDQGPWVITVNGPGFTSPPTWTGPIDVYDVTLNAGVTYWFELNHDPAADIKVLVFSSYGSPDYYYVVPRSARVAESTWRWTSYTAPATTRYGVVVVNDNGVADDYTLRVWSTTPVGVSDLPPVDGTGLRAVTPNPSAGPIQIQFALREPAAAAFEVLDLAGRMVARIPEQRREAGTWSVGWEGRASGGRPAPPGVYFVQMRVDGRRVGLARLALIR